MEIEATGSEGMEPTGVESGEPIEGVPTDDTGTPSEFGETEPVGGSEQEPVGEAPQMFTVKVGGVEQQVTLEDLQSGFMRQADYTRKTQEVAQMRQRLAQAEAIANSLESDPQGTLRALAEAFGVVAGESDDSYEFEEPDPIDQRLRAIERAEQERQAQNVRAQIDAEIDTLVNTYGDFDLQAVTAHAVQNGMTLTAAYRDLNFDSVATKAKGTQQVTAAKRDAAVVEGGSHRAGVVEQTKPANSIREAWRQAQKSLGRA